MLRPDCSLYVTQYLLKPAGDAARFLFHACVRGLGDKSGRVRFSLLSQYQVFKNKKKKKERERERSKERKENQKGIEITTIWSPNEQTLMT
jgi:hypothetical protein